MYHVEIRVKGHIDAEWSGWFDDLDICHSEPDQTLLSGQVVDQPALYGVLARLRDLGLALVSVTCRDIGSAQSAPSSTNA